MFPQPYPPYPPEDPIPWWVGLALIAAVGLVLTPILLLKGWTP